MKVIIDTNCLLASIPPKGNYYWLYESFAKEHFQWVLSTEVLLEYAEKLEEMYSKKTADLVLNILSVAPNSVFGEPTFRWNLIKNDPDDNKFVDLYMVANADFLVSNDKHFRILLKTEFPKINLLTLDKFKKILFSNVDFI